jgi:outer membrane receptor for ferrienterochelin and colicin
MHTLSALANVWKGGSLDARIEYSSMDMYAGMGRRVSIQSQKLHFIWLGSLSLSQQIGKNFRFRASVRNPWEKYIKTTSEIGTADFYSYSETRILGRSFWLSATYTFGRFEERVKSSRREIRNTDRTVPQ